MEPFVARQLQPMAIVVRALSVVAAAVVLVLLGIADLNPAILVVGVGGGALAAWRAIGRASVRLRLDAGGILLPAADHAAGGLTQVPWSSVRELELTVSQPPGGVAAPMTLAVRLTASAPLPRGIKGRITRPGDPDGEDEQLTARIGDLGLDAAALEAAVAAFGGDRPLTVRRIERFGIGA